MVQNMISKSIFCVLPKPRRQTIDEDGNRIELEDIREYTEQEIKDTALYRKYKDFEYETYKEIHKIVLADDGNPRLKKTAFRMTGYRKVLGDQDQEHIIDNTDYHKKVPELDQMIVPEDYLLINLDQDEGDLIIDSGVRDLMSNE